MFLSLLRHARPRVGVLARGKKGDGASECREYSTPNEPTQMRHIIVALMVATGPFVLGANLAFADGAGDPAAVKNEGGKYYDKESNPTFKVQSDCRLVHVFRVSPLSFGL